MFQLTELSRYDERGPAWYLNAFVTGEHTGAHFDAPAHWVTGKDLPDDPVDPSRRAGDGPIPRWPGIADTLAKVACGASSARMPLSGAIGIGSAGQGNNVWVTNLSLLL
jgi:Putative cyclase